MDISRFQADLAWAAGLFEGEGSFSLQRNKKYPQWVYPRATLSTSDLDVLQRFQKIMGFGKIYAQARRRNDKQLWVWNAGRKHHVFATISALFPLLGERRQAKAAEVFMACKG